MRKTRFLLFAPLMATLLQTPYVLAAENIVYTYDALGRLIKSQSSGSVNNNQTRTLCFDKAGNRMNYTANSSGVSPTCVTQG